MTNTEIMTMVLYLKLRNFYRRNKPLFLLLLLVVGLFAVLFFVRRRDSEAVLSVEPQWGDWHPVS